MTAGPGHNSKTDKGVSASHLKQFVERLERLEAERQGLVADVKEVYGELKSAGFCAKTTRKLVKLRKMDSADRENEQAMLDTYIAAVGL